MSSRQHSVEFCDCWVLLWSTLLQTVIETSVSAVLLERHVFPDAPDLLQVNLHQRHAWLLPSTVSQHSAPGVHHQGVAVGCALLVVCADLRCCQDVRLVLDCPCP